VRGVGGGWGGGEIGKGRREGGGDVCVSLCTYAVTVKGRKKEKLRSGGFWSGGGFEGGGGFIGKECKRR